MFKKVKKISTKLIIVFILVSVIASISGVLGAVILKSSDTRYGAALIDYGFAQGYIGRLGMVLNENRAYVRDIVFLTEKAQLDTANSQVQENVKKINELLETIRPTNTSEAAKALFAEIEAGLKEYQPISEQVIKYGMANDQERAYDLWINTAAPMINTVVDNAEKLLDMNVTAGTKESDTLTSSTNVTLLIIILVITAGLIISVAIAVYMARSISAPVIKVQQAAGQLAEGDLDFNISSDIADEVGKMTNSFADAAVMMRNCIADISHVLGELANGNFTVKPSVEYKGNFEKIEESISNIIVSLSSTLGQINQASEQVASGSDQVSSGAQALSQGATEQASSIEELSATISEISEQIKQSAASAQNAKEQSERAGSEVMNSNRQMQEMIAAMNDISSKSAEIGKIIKTIEDIAFQTNILALNAAVEAARAGAAGKGFAVVADEVRNLAGKSAEAAKNTTALIEETVTAVDNGTKIADNTAKAMLGVVDGAETVTKLIIDIASAAGNQANSISQITLGVEQISSVVQTNSATAEESAAASEELSGQAQMLKTLVSKFNLANVATNYYEAPAKNEKADNNDYSVNYDGSKY